MIVTRKYINDLRLKSGMNIDKPLEKYLLAEYEEEPFPYEYSDQDLYEQIRKLVYQYWRGRLDVTIKPPKDRLNARCEALKEQLLEALGEKACLEREIFSLKSELIKYGHMLPLEEDLEALFSKMNT